MGVLGAWRRQWQPQLQQVQQVLVLLQRVQALRVAVGEWGALLVRVLERVVGV